MKNLKTFRPIGLLFFATFLCSFFSVPIKGEIIDRVVAIVNKEIITLSELLKTAQSQSPNANQSFAPNNYRELLDGMIDHKLINQEALQTEITVSDREVDQFIEKFKKRNQITNSQLKTALQQQGLTWGKYREEVREEIRRSQIITQEIHSQVSVTKKDLKEYYQNHLDDYLESSQVKIEQIFFPFSPKIKPETKIDLALKAEEALKRIKSGEDFQKVAQEYNLTKETSLQGLDYFKKGELMAPLDEAAFRLKIGEASNVIKTEKGYFIIRVQDRREEKTKELNEVREEISNRIFQQKMEKKFREWLEELHKKAYIETKI